MKRAYLTGLAVTLAMLAASSGASASTGITRATVNPNWNNGSFAGSVDWSLHCAEGILDPSPGYVVLPHDPPFCAWTAFATVGPGADLADCKAPGRGTPAAPGPGITVVWSGTQSQGKGSASFDLSEVALTGQPAPLLCLSVVEFRHYPALCVVPEGGGPIVGCPLEEFSITTVRAVAAAEVFPETTIREPPAPQNETATTASLQGTPGVAPTPREGKGKQRARGLNQKRAKRSGIAIGHGRVAR